MSTNSNRPNIAEDFKLHHGSSIDPAKLTAILNQLEQLNTVEVLQASTAYSAYVRFSSLIMYSKVQCVIDGGETFNGTSWGINAPIGTVSYGDVYVADGYTLQDLYSETTAYSFVSTSVYLALYFFGPNHDLLGMFQGGMISTVTGNGGGSGSWS